MITIAQKETWKIKSQGGLKLINMQIKSETSKAKWLIEIVSNPELKTNLEIFSTLIGKQKGNISGKDTIFLQETYFLHQLETKNKFYKEALLAMAKFETMKGIEKIEHWDREHIFYNPLFLKDNGRTLSLTKYCEDNKIYDLNKLLEQKARESRNLPFDRVLANTYNQIRINTSVRKENILILIDGKEIKFTEVTQKILYEEAIQKLYTDHHSQAKWVLKLDTSIVWEDVWSTVHNILSTNQTKTIIWQQIHLNFYTQYSYNKWHKKQDQCPLCHKLPESIYHLMMDCELVNKLWDNIEPTLKQLHPVFVSNNERALGIVMKKPTTGVLLRNWLTFLLRKIISDAEREAYHVPYVNLDKIKKTFNKAMVSEITIKAFRYRREGNSQSFDKIFTYDTVLCEKQEDGEYQIKHILN